MRFPAKVGDKWKYKHEFPSASVANAQATWDISAEIDDWEEVKVPAGTFRAMRIEHDGYWERPDSRGRVEVVYWFSPDIGRVIKQSTKIFNRVGWMDTREEVRLTKYVAAPAELPKEISPDAKKD